MEPQIFWGRGKWIADHAYRLRSYQNSTFARKIEMRFYQTCYEDAEQLVGKDLRGVKPNFIG
jgi:hypothetical protein